MSGNCPVPPPNHPQPKPAPNSARYELVEPTGVQGAPFPPASRVVDGAPVPVSSQQLGQPAQAYSQEVPRSHLPPPPPPPPSPPPETPTNDTLALVAARATVDVLPLAVTLFHLISKLEAGDAQALIEAVSQWIAQVPNGQHTPPPPVTPPPKPPKSSRLTLEQTHTLAALFARWVVYGPGGHPPPPPTFTPPPKPPKSSPALKYTERIARASNGQHPPPPPPTPPPKAPKQGCDFPPWIAQVSNGQHPPPPPPTPPPKAPNQKHLAVEFVSQLNGGHPPPPPPTAPPKPPKSSSFRAARAHTAARWARTQVCSVCA